MSPGQSHQEPIQHLILPAGILTEEAWAEWSVRAIEVLQRQAGSAE